MQIIQILFPDPMMRRLLEVADQEDVPLSKIIRKATALWLDRLPTHDTTVKRKPWAKRPILWRPQPATPSDGPANETAGRSHGGEALC
jgi:hypothetical protein